jgi:hypothetical protein
VAENFQKSPFHGLATVNELVLRLRFRFGSFEKWQTFCKERPIGDVYMSRGSSF